VKVQLDGSVVPLTHTLELMIKLAPDWVTKVFTVYHCPWPMLTGSAALPLLSFTG